MSNVNTERLPEDRHAYDSVRPFAQGGKPKDYYQFLIGSGRKAYLCRNKDIWLHNSRWELYRHPYPGRLVEPNPEDIRKALSLKGIWIASYICEPTEDHPANVFLYVCQDSEYDIEKLNKPARRDVRKGLRNFSIRLCSWQEIINQGYAAESDTRTRHGYALPSHEKFAEMTERYQFNDLFEVWGAWHGDDLAAWSLICKIDNCAYMLKACSRTDYLRREPNIALHYCLTKHLLITEKRTWVTSGVSSITEGTRLGLHRYKVRSGYTVVPVRHEYVVSPVLTPLLKSKAISWCLETTARYVKGYPILEKASGLLRLTSGREKDPLGWADSNTGH